MLLVRGDTSPKIIESYDVDDADDGEESGGGDHDPKFTLVVDKGVIDAAVDVEVVVVIVGYTSKIVLPPLFI